MLETQVRLTMLLSDQAIPYLLKTSINMLLLQTLIYVRVYFIRLLSMNSDLINIGNLIDIQNLIKVIYTWQRKMTAEVRNVRGEIRGRMARNSQELYTKERTNLLLTSQGPT